MYKYACLNNIAEAGLKDFGEDFEQTENLDDADGIIVRSAKLHDMEFSPNLKCIVRAGVGVNNVPLDQCNEKGIVLFNTPGANANAVKEMVISGMLLASRNIIGANKCIDDLCVDDNIKEKVEKRKKKFAGREIAGKKLGIIGLGEIGVLVANAAIALGMDVIGYDPFLSVKHAWSLDRSVKRVLDVNEIYQNCDFITIHIPLVEATKNTIDQEAIDQMKEGVVILNYARDILCDENAIVKGLNSGKIRKYVTDFANSTVVGQMNCIITPHIGASTYEAEENSAKMAVAEMKDFLLNGNINHSVNYSNCDMGVCESAQRLTICNLNVENMIANFTKILSEQNINIDKMLNSSKGDYAYTMFDINKKLDQETWEKLLALDGVIKVRVF